MMRIKQQMILWKILCITLIFGFVAALSTSAQQTAQPVQTAAPASASSAAVVPAPSQPKALLKVFISNLPSEEEPGISDSAVKTYDSFYAAMKRAGQYELVSDPAQADLLFQLIYARPWHCVMGFGTIEDPTRYRETEEFDPAIAVTALDRKTHALLATHDTDLKQKQKTWDKNFEKAIETLVELMGTGLIPKGAAVTLPGKPSPAPAPSPLGAATTLFIANPVVDRTQMMKNPQDLYTQVSLAMKSWGRYKLVSNVADADLVADLAVTQPWGPKCEDAESAFGPSRQIELRITDPKTNTLIWGFAESLWNSHDLFSKHRFGSSQSDLKRTSVSLVKQIRELTARADAAAGHQASIPQASSH
ncbi:MAG TPA: hypothetical protein VKE93_00740 [Candidatus Angelobacter sp.]|nr:hypothetical protein [Candidatus Angelobacter sp.]